MSIKKEEKAEINLGTIVDMSSEEYAEYVKTLNVGNASSIRNLLTQTYEELRIRKDKILELSKSEHNELIKGIYSKLHSIENKHIYISQYIQGLNKAVVDNAN